MSNGFPIVIITEAAFRDEAVDVGVPFKISSKGMENHNKARGITFRFVIFMKHVENNTGNSMEEAIQKRAVMKEEVT